MEVVPNIHRIVAPLGERFVCVFVLVGDEATLVVDTGIKSTPQEQIKPYFDEKGLDLNAVRYVLISHADFDHNGGNGGMKDIAPNAVFMCHEFDRAMIADTRLMISDRYNAWADDHGYPVNPEGDQGILDNMVSDIPIDMGLSGGEVIRLSADWHVHLLHTAGHSHGHMTVYDPKSKTAVIADAALYNSVLTADGKPAFPPTYRYLDTYQATLQRFLGMEIDTLLGSHYAVQQGEDVKKFLGESLSYTHRVDDALADTLRGGGAMTLLEIIADIHTKIGDWPEGAEAFLNFPLTGHLEQMEQYGRVKLGRRDGIVTYEWVG